MNAIFWSVDGRRERLGTWSDSGVVKKCAFFGCLFRVTKLRTGNRRISAVKIPVPRVSPGDHSPTNKHEDSGNEIRFPAALALCCTEMTFWQLAGKLRGR